MNNDQVKPMKGKLFKVTLNSHGASWDAKVHLLEAIDRDHAFEVAKQIWNGYEIDINKIEEVWLYIKSPDLPNGGKWYPDL